MAAVGHSTASRFLHNWDRLASTRRCLVYSGRAAGATALCCAELVAAETVAAGAVAFAGFAPQLCSAGGSYPAPTRVCV